MLNFITTIGKKKKFYGNSLPAAIANSPADCHGIPLPLVRGADYIEEFYLEVEGIYRVSGTKNVVEKLMFQYDYYSIEPDLKKYDPFVVTGSFKRFLTLLPEPLMTFERYDKFLAAQKNKDKTQRKTQVKQLISSLPEDNQRVLEFVIGHLKTVSEYFKENKMGPNNLAIVFGPSLFRSKDDSAIRMLTDAGALSGLVQTMLTEYEYIFGDLDKEPAPTPRDNTKRDSADAKRNSADALTASIKTDSPILNSIEEMRNRRKQLNRSSISNDAIPVAAITEDLQPLGEGIALNFELPKTGKTKSTELRERMERRRNRATNLESHKSTITEQPVADVGTIIKDISQEPTKDNSADVAIKSDNSESMWNHNLVISHDTPTGTAVLINGVDGNSKQDDLENDIRSFVNTSSTTSSALETDKELLAKLQAVSYDFDKPVESVQARLAIIRQHYNRKDNIETMTPVELDEEHKMLKREIRAYEVAFAQAKCRTVSKIDKEQLKPLYKRYQQTRKLSNNADDYLDTVDSKLDSVPLDASYISPKSPLYELVNKDDHGDTRTRSKTKSKCDDDVVYTRGRSLSTGIKNAYSRRSVHLESITAVDAMISAIHENPQVADILCKNHEYMSVRDKQKEVKRKIRKFQADFTKQHGRKPKKSEREAMAPLYDEYRQHKEQLDAWTADAEKQFALNNAV